MSELLGTLRWFAKTYEDKTIAKLLAAAVAEIDRLSANVKEENSADMDLHSLILREKEDDDKLKCHVLRVGKRTQRIAYGACGCCLVKLYKIVRDKGVMKEGETFDCHLACSQPKRWVVKDGILRWA